MTFAVALSFAKAGIRIIPVRVFLDGARWRKLPYINEWRQRASTDPSIIEEWWCQFPHAVPGIVLEHYGRVVVDCDRHPNSPDGVAEFEKLGPFPPHPIVKTAGNGFHHYFLQPQSLVSGTFVPFAGIEVMGIKRFVCAPGAGGYSLIADVTETPILPEVFWPKRTAKRIAKRIAHDPSAEAEARESVHHIVDHSFEPTHNYPARMKAIVNWVARTQSPGRSHTLFAGACIMAKMWVFEGRPSPKVAEQMLIDACRANGLVRDYDKAKCKQTIANAYRLIEEEYPNDALSHASATA
jgi:hypothetical protein